MIYICTDKCMDTLKCMYVCVCRTATTSVVIHAIRSLCQSLNTNARVPGWLAPSVTHLPTLPLLAIIQGLPLPPPSFLFTHAPPCTHSHLYIHTFTYTYTHTLSHNTLPVCTWTNTEYVWNIRVYTSFMSHISIVTNLTLAVTA